MLRRNGPVVKSVESVLRLEGKAAYRTTLGNVDFRRLLSQQCTLVELTLKHYPSFCIPHSPPVLLSGHW